jgi:hypothetical protein
MKVLGLSFGLAVLMVMAGALQAQAGHPATACGHRFGGCEAAPCGNCACENCQSCDNCGHGGHRGHRGYLGREKLPFIETWDGAYWGSCPIARSRNLHLWDNYCVHTSPCPCCGHNQGGAWCRTFCKKECLFGECGGAPRLADGVEAEATPPASDDPPPPPAILNPTDSVRAPRRLLPISRRPYYDPSEDPASENP